MATQKVSSLALFATGISGLVFAISVCLGISELDSANRVPFIKVGDREKLNKELNALTARRDSIASLHDYNFQEIRAKLLAQNGQLHNRLNKGEISSNDFFDQAEQIRKRYFGTRDSIYAQKARDIAAIDSIKTALKQSCR